MPDKLTVKNIRNLLDLTQEEMAQKLDIGYVSYRNKEAGKTPWNHEEIAKILKLSGKSYEQLKFG